MTDQELRAELRQKSTIELHGLVTARETPEATRNMAQEVLWERGKLNETLPTTLPSLALENNETLKKMLPMAPQEGPPLPRAWGIRWFWKKSGVMN